MFRFSEYFGDASNPRSFGAVARGALLQFQRAIFAFAIAIALSWTGLFDRGCDVCRRRVQLRQFLVAMRAATCPSSAAFFGQLRSR
jgi:hypothetical protein